MTDFPGLIFLQYSDSNGAEEVTAYWKSREATAANAGSLQAALGAGSIISEGYLRSLDGLEKHWWEGIAIFTWFLYIVSFLGALAAFQTYFAQTLERPDVNPEIVGPVVLNVVSSEEIRFALSITNRSREVSSKVIISKPYIIHLPDKNPVAREFQFTKKPAPIGPTTTVVVPFIGESLPAGTYRLSLNVTARTGFLAGSDSFPVTKELTVRTPDPQSRIISASSLKDPQKARIRVELLVGAAAPYGVSCRATVKNSTHVRIQYVDFAGALKQTSLPDVNTPGQERRSVDFWTHRPLEKLQTYSFSLAMEADSGAVNWDFVKQNIKVECSPNEQEVPK